jgi:hypothetical protein
LLWLESGWKMAGKRLAVFLDGVNPRQPAGVRRLDARWCFRFD